MSERKKSLSLYNNLRHFGIGNNKGVCSRRAAGRAGRRSVAAVVELNTCCAAQ
jgi:hypothetical protein